MPERVGQPPTRSPLGKGKDDVRGGHVAAKSVDVGSWLNAEQCRRLAAQGCVVS